MTTSHVLRASLCAGLLVGAPACVLEGILPEEIDHADGDTGSDDGGEGDDGDPDTGGGDGDGDGDGNGDDEGDEGGDGDGDGDTSGDEGDGDGDGDETGDGDGDGDSCSGFDPLDVSEGMNQVEVFDGASLLASSCGGAGPESIYRFMAPADGEWLFTIEDSEFTEVLTLVDSCDPLAELACSAAPASVQRSLIQGEAVFVIVDSEAGTGSATLTISLL